MQNTNLNTNPYFDDFDKSKNFYRVLFRPGYPVQSRELTTLQSILQNQIENFGSSIYKEGAMVIPGQIGFDLNYHAIKIQASYNGISVEKYRESLVGLTIRGLTTNVRARIVGTLSATDPQNTSGNIVLYIKYISSGINSDVTEFTSSENLVSETDISLGTTVIPTTSPFARTVTENPNQTGSSAYINDGVYYIRGYFVNVPAQSIILDPFDVKPSYKIGLQVQENIITSEDDESLYDNAIGTSNYTAPGAHRFQITTTLIKKDIDDPDTSNFIELLRLKSGEIQYFVNRSAYSELEKELARRTYNTNGDYIVSPFNVSVRENLSNGINNGVYGLGVNTQQGNVPSEDKVAVQISSGTAYVKGYEIQTVGTTYIDANKARITAELNNQNVTNTFGSYIEVYPEDVKGLFELDDNITKVKLFDEYQNTLGSNTGNLVGEARIVNIEKGISSISSNGQVYKLFLIDISLELGKTISDIKSIIHVNTNSPEDSSYANCKLHNFTNSLSGTVTLPVITPTGTGSTISGFSTNFLSELRQGDILYAASGSNGAIQKFIVTNIASNTTATIKNLSTSNSVAGSYNISVGRVRLEDSSNNQLFTVLPKTYTKSLTVDSLPIRSQIKNITASGTGVTISSPEANYVFTNASDVVVSYTSDGIPSSLPNATASTSNNGNNLIVNFGQSIPNGSTVDISFTLNKTSTSSPKIKPLRKMKVLLVTGTGTAAYGTRLSDNKISLGIPDVTKVHAVFESTGSANPIIPNFQYTLGAGITDNFEVGEIIKGSSSLAVARIISSGTETENSTSVRRIYFVYESQDTFSDGETIIGLTNGTVATVSNIVTGSPDIKNRFTFSDGQEDQFYNFSSLVLKNGETSPTNKIFVVFDFFDREGQGDYFSVNSYNNQIDYKDIPKYKNIPLSDIIDYRYTVNKIVQNSGTRTDPYTYLIPSVIPSISDVFSFYCRTSVGFDTFRFFKQGLDCVYDTEYYLPRIDRLVINSNGTFNLINGQPAESPSAPSAGQDDMVIADIKYPAYTINADEVVVQKYEQKRYTMKDISKLETRLKNVEYYTQLSLLELATANMSVTDANGLERFKNGFIVDNFTDASKSDVSNVDYQCAIDPETGSLRPSHYTTNVSLTFSETNGTTSIQRTGDLLTLPYTSVVSIEQPKASRVENVNPFNVFTWVGSISLSPSSDDWMDTTRVADQVTNLEGNYASTAALINADQNGYGPTEWGSWTTTWTGTETLTSSSASFAASGSGRRPLLQRDTYTTRGNQSRQGVRSVITARTDTVDLGDRTISTTSITHIRSRNISFESTRLSQKTRFYAFFDGTDVNTYVTPKLVEITMLEGTFNINETIIGNSSGARMKVLAPNNGFIKNPYSTTDVNLPSTYSSNSTVLNIDLDSLSSTINTNYYGRLIAGETIRGLTSGARAIVSSTIRLVSDINGRLSGTFFIPNPSDNTNPRFETGTKTFRLTSSPTNSTLVGGVDSSAQVNYTASGTLQTVQRNLVSIRNANLSSDTVTENRENVVLSTRTSDKQVGWYDPLAESFLVVSKGGEFLTKVDLYFQAKDTSNIPVTIQIRTMENGTPTKTILPFSEVTVNASDVNISNDASAATTFTFESPVYVEENEEYALVVLSSSNQYRVWISRMGDNDIITSSPISNQPYTGVLFKSQNASTWTPDQYEDLKFKIYRANFTSLQGTATFISNGGNNNLTLGLNPISTSSGSSTITVYHSNHGMHANNVDKVILSGVKSEIPSVTLNTAIASSASFNSSPGGIGTITVSSNPGFHTSIGGAPISTSNPGYIKINDEIFAYSAVSGNNLSIIQRAVPGSGSSNISHRVGDLVECYNLAGVPLTLINNIVNTVKNPTLDSYQLALSKPANSTVRAGGSTATASQNVRYDVITPEIQTVNISGTNLSATINACPGKSINGNETPYSPSEYNVNIPVTLNEINILSAPKIVASTVNQVNNFSNIQSFKLLMNFSSGSSNLSPVIDLDRSSIITTTNRICGNIESISSGSTLATGDNSKAIYITKLVRLNNPATSIKVMFSAWRPNGSVIDVYYKALASSNDDIDSFGYTKFSESADISNIPAPTDQEEYRDYEYNVDNLNFSAFAIKIVMRSSSQVKVPILKEFRAMAVS